MTSEDLRRDPLPLRGRAALVTGVSRRRGIGYAIACRMAGYGASVYFQHFAPHDEEQEWGGDSIAAVTDGVARHLHSEAVLGEVHADLTAPGAPQQVVDGAVKHLGRLDVLVCNHALSGEDGALGELTESMLDRHWAVNTRSAILLAQAFAAAHDGHSPASITFMTSGQDQGPMPGEVAYATAKAGLVGITVTLADQLADSGIRVNTVNPGPVDTGYLTEEMWRQVAPMFPFGRFGQPDDPARLIAWLATSEASWITGQVINTEGGFGRWRPRG